MTAPTIDSSAVDSPQLGTVIEDLDISFLEAGDTVDHIIKMTNDNCGNTCESACTSC